MPPYGYSGPPYYPDASYPPPYLPSYPPPPPLGPPPGPPRRSNAPAIIAIVAVVAVCLLGAVGAVFGGLVLLSKGSSSGSYSSSPNDTETPPDDEGYTPDPTRTTTPPVPAPVAVGQCIAVDEAGGFLGVGNCNGSSGTYRVLSVDAAQGTCSDPESPYITVRGHRLCLALYLVRSYCYKFPKGSGWVVAASKCKAAGTVLVVDILPNANNGDNCTRDYQWNRWYRTTHPTVVYCVMQY